MRRLKLAAAVLLAALLAGAGAFQAAIAFRPFETSVALRRLALRRGAEPVRLAGLAGWERDSCAPGAPCRCVALVHGMGDSALTWDKLMLGRAGEIPAGTRLLALNLPGTDGSAPPPEPEGYAVPAQAKALREALAARCGRWTVVGNSLGGWISAELALQWPEGVDSLLLVNPAGLSDDSGLLLEVARALAEPTVEKIQGFMRLAYFTPREVPERAWPAVVEQIRRRPTRAVFAALRHEHVLDRRARGIRAATVVLWGEADRAVPAALGERLARLIPGARLERVPRCGHLPQQECPAAVWRALFERS